MTAQGSYYVCCYFVLFRNTILLGLWLFERLKSANTLNGKTQDIASDSIEWFLLPLIALAGLLHALQPMHALTTIIYIPK